MAWTQADIDALKSAIGTGARKVRFATGGEERETVYRSQAEMLEALALMEREVQAAQSPRISIARHNRGVF